MRPASLAIAAAAILAGCGSTSSSTAPTGASSPSASSHIAFPLGSASGTVKSVNGSDVQLDTTHGPRSVLLESATTYTRTTPATRSAIVVGDCVGITSGLARAGARSIKAMRVAIISPTPCARPTAGGGSPPIGSGSAAPDLGSSSAGAASGAAAQLVATVTAVSPESFVVKSFETGSKPATIVTGTRTGYEGEQPTDAMAVQPGACVAVEGQKPGTTLDAITVTIFAPCSLATAVPPA